MRFDPAWTRIRSPNQSPRHEDPRGICSTVQRFKWDGPVRACDGEDSCDRHWHTTTITSIAIVITLAIIGIAKSHRHCHHLRD